MTLKGWLFIALELVLTAALVSMLLGQVSAEKKRAAASESLAQQRQETINDMQVRQRDVAALDAKYTGELADAKAKLDALQQCVSSGKCGLRVNATCSAKSNAARATGVDDAASARLTDAAQRDYFTLRGRIATVTGQLTGLQDFVRQQCLK